MMDHLSARRSVMKKLTYTFLLTLLSSISLYATVYYVSPTGDADFNTIQAAVNTAQAGDTIYIKAGTYHERILFSRSGHVDKPIVIKNNAKEIVTIDGDGINWDVNWGGLLDFDHVSYIHISGLTVINSSHAGIFLDTSDHIRIERSKTNNTYSSGIGVWYSHHINIINNEVSLACNNGGEECISIVHSHNVLVDRNEVHHNGPGSIGGEGIDVKEGSHDVMVSHNEVHHLNERIGLYTDPWDTHTYNIVFDSNRVHDCTNFGMAIASEMGGLIEHVIFMNNLVYHNFDGGMAVGGWTADGQSVDANPIHHLTIINNTIYDNQNSDGLYIANPDIKDIKVYNNIIGRNDDSQIYIENASLSEIDIKANLIEGITGNYGEQKQVTGDPKLIDAASGDFHLLPHSPAINQGISHTIATHDHDGIKRPQENAWDIGAYEYIKTKENPYAFLVPILYLLL